MFAPFALALCPFASQYMRRSESGEGGGSTRGRSRYTFDRYKMAIRGPPQTLVMSNTVVGLAVATAIAFGTTYYYWLLMKPRWATLATRKGKTLTSVDSIRAFTDPTWHGLVRRSFYRPFITSVGQSKEMLSSYSFRDYNRYCSLFSSHG